MELAVILIGLIVLGLCSGLFGALFGLGGGVIFVPILLLSGVAETATQAVAMSLVGIIAGSVGASTVLISKGLSNVRLGLMMEITTCIGAIIGAILATSRVMDPHGPVLSHNHIQRIPHDHQP